MSGQTLLVVLWEWPAGSKHAGSRFWACHDPVSDARIRDWPEVPLGLVPRGASLVAVVEGEGLDLVRAAEAGPWPPAERGGS